MNEKLADKYFEEITEEDGHRGFFEHIWGNEDISFFEIAQKGYNEYMDKLKKDEIGIEYNKKVEFEKEFYKERYDLMDCLKRGDYKKLFDNYINFCSKNEKRAEVKHLFTVYKEIKSYIISFISYKIFSSIIGRIKNLIKDDILKDVIFPMTIDNLKAVIKDEFIYDILFDNEYGKDQIDEMFFKHLLEDVGYMIELGIEKEIQKIDILFLEYVELIEKQENKSKEDKKKALTDEQFKIYKDEYLTPRKKPLPEYIEKNLMKFQTDILRATGEHWRLLLKILLSIFLSGM
ncbi:MAG: hypothetical protein LBB81_02300 [Treponema sp.]|jgi:hypothetical protein|nr:hypothetical protein [Treponema sp.]